MAHTNNKVAFQLAYPHDFEKYNAVIGMTKEAKENKKISGVVLELYLKLITRQLNAFLKERQAGLYVNALDNDLNSLEATLRSFVEEFNKLKKQFQRDCVHVPDIEFPQPRFKDIR